MRVLLTEGPESNAAAALDRLVVDHLAPPVGPPVVLLRPHDHAVLALAVRLPSPAKKVSELLMVGVGWQSGKQRMLRETHEPSLLSTL